MQFSQQDISTLVIAGGQASRIGGIDKTMLPLGIKGGTLLEEVVAACPAPIVVVGAPRPIKAEVTWVADLVQAGGPAAGIWAGLPHIATEYVFISAGDQQLTGEIVAKICSAANGKDGAWALRSDGQGQPLLACVKSDLLWELLAPTQGVNASPLKLMQQLDMVGIKVEESQVRDVDTWSDVAALIKENKMSEITPIWLAQVAQLLGLTEEDIPVDELLDLTREVAHNVERKSAPLTTFLIGLAAGKTNQPTQELIKQVEQAVQLWVKDE